MITALAVVPGGGQVATAGDDHVVRIWSMAEGTVLHTLKWHNDWVRTLAFSPDGAVLASAGDDRQIILWQIATGKRLAQLPAASLRHLRPGLQPRRQTTGGRGL